MYKQDVQTTVFVYWFYAMALLCSQVRTSDDVFVESFASQFMFHSSLRIEQNWLGTIFSTLWIQ